VVGSIGFHGLPDEHGRLETSCRIEASSRGRGYAAEALNGLLEWAAAQCGIRRFLVAVTAAPAAKATPVDVAIDGGTPTQGGMAALAGLLEDL
jgi:hypothetical protein